MKKKDIFNDFKTEVPDLSRSGKTIEIPKFITAIFPGTFDPPTKGHLDIVIRAARLYSKVIWAIAVNPEKHRTLFSLSERLDMMKELTRVIRNVEIVHFEGATVDFAKEKNASAIIRGFRTITDIEYETEMAYFNEDLGKNIFTTFIVVSKDYSYISSRLVRELIKLGKDVSAYVPDYVYRIIKKKYGLNKK